MGRIETITEKLPKVFTPSAPVSDARFLQGREQILSDLKAITNRNGASIVVYGERGVGKTSIAKVTFDGLEANNFYYSASQRDTFDTIAAAILKHYDTGWTPEYKQHDETSEKDAHVTIPIAKGGVAFKRVSAERIKPLIQVAVTPNEVATRLPNAPSLIIVDDFERIESASSRTAFADLIKKLSDHRSLTTLMLVGIGKNVDEVLGAHHSAQRSLSEIHVPRLSDEQIGDIIVTGMAALNLTIDDDAMEQIVDFSANFPYYTHLLCEGAVWSLINGQEKGRKSTWNINGEEIKDSVDFAIRNAERSISKAYEDGIRNINETQRFKHVLYAIATWPEEPAPYKEIALWVGKVEHTATAPNVSYHLATLEQVGILEKTAAGLYRFRNPFLKAYVILRARSDTPEKELAAIDAQISETKKRLLRLRARLDNGEMESTE
jgi:hypothetical protein